MFTLILKFNSCLFIGVPVRAEDISTKRKLTEDILSDPRPRKYRNNPGYCDFVRNSLINYCAFTSHDISMRYLHSKADIQVKHT